MPPNVDGAPGTAESVNLDLVEIAPTAEFVLSYEAPRAYDATGLAKGVIVIRRAADGEVEALYDVPRVSDLTIAPDGQDVRLQHGDRSDVHGGRTRSALEPAEEWSSPDPRRTAAVYRFGLMIPRSDSPKPRRAASMRAVVWTAVALLFARRDRRDGAIPPRLG